MERDLGKRRKPRPRLWDRLMLRLSKAEQFDGLWIGAFDDRPEPFLHRVREALQLIKTYDPLRYARITRDLKRLWVCGGLATIACFNYRLDACQFDDRFVLAETTTPELLASVIVHEATHARLWNWGVRYDEPLRSRVEAICIRRQLAFAKRLPDGQQSREWAEQILTSADPMTLSNAGFWKRDYDWRIEELHRLGVPDWAVRAIVILAHAIWAVQRSYRTQRRRFSARAPQSRA
jgi:hypothetical protein